MLELTIDRHYGKYPGEESFIIYKNSVSTDNKLYTMTGSYSLQNTNVTETTCVPPGSLVIELKDTAGDGWGYTNSASYVRFLWNNVEIYRGCLPFISGASNTLLTVGLYFNPVVTAPLQLKYTDSVQSGSAWRQPNFDDSTWSSGTSASFPSFTSTTRYYRLTSGIPALSTMNALQLMINSPNGFIVYVNGDEVYRYKISYTVSLPDGLDTSSIADDNEFKMVTFKKYLLNESGTNVIAFELHLPSSGINSADSFALYLGRIGDGVSNDFPTTRLNQFEITSSPVTTSSYSPIWKVLDASTYSYWTVTGTSVANITYSFPHNNAEYINCYRLRNTQYSTYGGIYRWYLYGSNDGENWSLVDLKDDPFPLGTPMYKEYTMPGNVFSYKKLRLSLEGASDNKYGVAIFQAGVCNLPNIGNEIYYETNSINGYSNFLNVNIPSGNVMFTSYIVTPPFPTGLALDYSTGLIHGTPVGSGTTVHTIHAVHRVTGVSSTFEFTITLTTCEPSTHTHWRFYKVNKNFAYEELYIVYNQNNDVLYESPTFTNNINHEIHLCLPTQQIRVYINDTFNDGWTSGSNLQIDINTGIANAQVGRIANAKYGERNVYFDPTALLPSLASSWTFLQGNVPTNWYQTTASGSFASYSYNSAPASTSNVWLFRNTFTINSLSGIVALDIKVYIRAGFVLYLNGQEVYRYNIDPTAPITASMEPTASETDSFYYTLSAAAHLLQVGSNVLAIGVINSSTSNPSQVLFDAFILPIHENKFGRTYDIEITSSSSGYTNYLVDQRTDLEFSASHSVGTPVTLTYKVHPKFAEYYNKFCMTSSYKENSEKNDPSDFSFAVSNDNAQYTTLMEVHNFAFSARSQEYCFYLTSNLKPWRYYKITLFGHLDSTATSYALSELYPYQIDLAVIEPPPLSYNTTTVYGVTGLPFPVIYPNSPYYFNYTIAPALPGSLTMDPITGRIQGSYSNILPATTYTVTAYTPLGVSSSTTLTIRIDPCASPKIMFTIKIVTGSWGEEMGFVFKNRNGQVLAERTKFSKQSTYYYPMCDMADTYYFTAKDTRADGWDNGYYNIYLNDNTTVLTGTLGARVYEETFVVSIGYVVSPMLTEYRYLNGNTAPANWKDVNFVDATWSLGLVSSFGNAASTTQYFRRSFSIDHPESYADFALTIKSRYGYIAYLNGKEVFRYNMPDGDVTSSTNCLQDFVEIIKTERSFPFIDHSLNRGTNTLAVEVHLPSGTADLPMSFDSSLLVYAEDTYKGNNGVAISDLAEDSTIKDLFDNDKGSIYYNSQSCVGRTLTYTFNNGARPFVNSYSIYTGRSCNRRHPSGWRLEGSNDGEKWVILHVVSNQLFSAYSTEVFFKFYNEIGYNSYRMVVTECNNVGLGTSYSEQSCNYPSDENPGFQLAEISFFSKFMNNFCRPQDGYLGAFENEVAYKNCNQYYLGQVHATCSGGVFVDTIEECTVDVIRNITYPPFIQFTKKQHGSVTPIIEGAEYECTVAPQLPAGLSIDAATGTISGSCSNVFDLASFQVSCENKAGKITKPVFISCVEAPASLWWMYLVIVVLAVILIGIFLFCIINRSKSRHMKHKNLEKSKTKSTSKSNNTTTKTIKI